MRVSLVERKKVQRAYIRYHIKHGNIYYANGKFHMTDDFKADLELGNRLGIGPPGMMNFIIDYMGL